MPARRCNTHGNWPVGSKFHECQECEEKTDWVSNADPMDETEVNHRLFDVFCRDRDATLKEQVDGLEAAVSATQSIPDPSGSEDLLPLPEQSADAQPEGD